MIYYVSVGERWFFNDWDGESRRRRKSESFIGWFKGDSTLRIGSDDGNRLIVGKKNYTKVSLGRFGRRINNQNFKSTTVFEEYKSKIGK